MSRRIAYYDRLNMNAAAFSEACLIVRARLVEAADTMCHIHVSGAYPAMLKASWPDYVDDYGNETTRSPYRPSARAITRAEEVFYNWMSMVQDDGQRKILCGWAFCLSFPKRFGSFDRFCKKNRINRRTAERHIIAVLQDITAAILKKDKSLQCPDWKRVSQSMPKSGIDFDKMSTVTFWRSEDAKPRNCPEMRSPA